MRRYLFVFLQILLFASLSHAETTLAQPIGLRNIFRNIGRMVQSPPSFSGLSQSLFALPFLSKFVSLLREGVVKSEEIETEAERRRNIQNSFPKSEKTFQELSKDRQERIKELKQKIEMARYSLKETKGGETLEEMLAELHELQTSPVKFEFEKNDKESSFVSHEIKPGLLAQQVKAGSYQIPGVRMLPTEKEPVAKSETPEESESAPERAVCVLRADGSCEQGEECRNINPFDMACRLRHARQPSPVCSNSNDKEWLENELAGREEQRLTEEANRLAALGGFPVLTGVKYPTSVSCKLEFEGGLDLTLPASKFLSRVTTVFKNLDSQKAKVCISATKRGNDYECLVRCTKLATEESFTGQFHVPGMQAYERTTTAVRTANGVLELEKLVCPPYRCDEEVAGLPTKWVRRLFERNHQLLSTGTVSRNYGGPISISKDVRSIEEFCSVHNLYRKDSKTKNKREFKKIIEEDKICGALQHLEQMIRKRESGVTTFATLIGQALRDKFLDETPVVFRREVNRLQSLCESYRLGQSDFEALNPADPSQLFQLASVEANALVWYALSGFALNIDWYHIGFSGNKGTIIDLMLDPSGPNIVKASVTTRDGLYRSCCEIAMCEAVLTVRQTTRRDPTETQRRAQVLDCLESAVVNSPESDTAALNNFLNASFSARDLDAAALCLNSVGRNSGWTERTSPFVLLTTIKLYETPAEGTETRFVTAFELWDRSGKCLERDAGYSNRLPFADVQEELLDSVGGLKNVPSFYVVCNDTMIQENLAQESLWGIRRLPFSVVPSGLSVYYLQSRWEEAKRLHDNTVRLVTNDERIQTLFGPIVHTVEQPGATDSIGVPAINLVVLCGHNDQVRNEIERLSAHQRSGILILGCCNLDRLSLCKLQANFTSIVCSAGKPRAADAVPLVSDMCDHFLKNRHSIAQSLMLAKEAFATNGVDVESYGFYCRGLDASLAEQPAGFDELGSLRSARVRLTYIDDDERLVNRKPPEDLADLKKAALGYPAVSEDPNFGLIPIGFTKNQLIAFVKAIKKGLPGTEPYFGAEIAFNGSSLNGYSFRKKDTPRNFGPHSDYDVAICFEDPDGDLGRLNLEYDTPYDSVDLAPHFNLPAKFGKNEVHYIFSRSVKEVSGSHSGPTLLVHDDAGQEYSEAIGNWDFTTWKLQSNQKK
ncbi:MAG: hypothetical protein WCK49_00970 [Myxococcaceae bacterium]